MRTQLAAAAHTFHECASYLLRILRNKALQLGGDDGLEELLARLDFNAAQAPGSMGWAGH